MTGLINRWRHRHGFGVHSPLAFRIVREIWPESKLYSYYGYHKIDCVLEKSFSGTHLRNNQYKSLWKLLRETRRLLRLAIFFKTKDALLLAADRQPWQTALRCAGVKHVSFSARAVNQVAVSVEMIADPEGMLSDSDISSILAGHPERLVIITRTASSQGKAMEIRDGSTALIISGPDFSPIVYEI